MLLIPVPCVPPCTAQAIFAEGKVHPLAVGVLKMSTADMYGDLRRNAPPPLVLPSPLDFVAQTAHGSSHWSSCVPMCVYSKSKNTGIAVEVLHYLDDNLWRAHDDLAR